MMGLDLFHLGIHVGGLDSGISPLYDPTFTYSQAQAQARTSSGRVASGHRGNGHSGVGEGKERDREEEGKEDFVSRDESRASVSGLAATAREGERERGSRRRVCQAKHSGTHSVSGAMIDQRGQLTSSWRRALAALAGSRPSCQLISMCILGELRASAKAAPSSFGPRLAHQNVGKRNIQTNLDRLPHNLTLPNEEPRFLYPMHEYPLATLLCQSTLNVHDGTPAVSIQFLPQQLAARPLSLPRRRQRPLLLPVMTEVNKH